MPSNRPGIFRPPSERRSYYLPLTSGCANNSCTFCTFYGSRLQTRPLEDVMGEIGALAIYRRSGIRLQQPGGGVSLQSFLSVRHKYHPYPPGL